MTVTERTGTTHPVTLRSLWLQVMLLQLAGTHAGGCACDHGTEKLCCGQTLDQGKPTCAAGHDCGVDLPLCSGYVNNQHLGECVAASCSIGMTGTGLSCPAHTLGDENTCIVKHTDAEEVCQKTAGCDYIGVCSQFSEGCKSWNGRYTDSVQLSKAPLIHNDDWIACKPGTEPGAPSSDLGAYFLLLLALIGGAPTWGAESGSECTRGGGVARQRSRLTLTMNAGWHSPGSCQMVCISREAVVALEQLTGRRCCRGLRRGHRTNLQHEARRRARRGAVAAAGSEAPTIPAMGIWRQRAAAGRATRSLRHR